MKTSQKGIDLIKKFESLHDGDLTIIGLQPKMDPIGIWTEGYGHAMRDQNGMFLRGWESYMTANLMASVYDDEEATLLLIKDLDIYENIVMRKITVPLNQNQFDSLVSYTYNTGGSDTLFRYVNTNKPDGVIRDWFENHYITAGGKKLNGLIRRRKEEADLYFS